MRREHGPPTHQDINFATTWGSTLPTLSLTIGVVMGICTIVLFFADLMLTTHLSIASRSSPMVALTGFSLFAVHLLHMLGYDYHYLLDWTPTQLNVVISSMFVFHLLLASAPRRLWSTFRAFTKQSSAEPTCTPDQQWDHWASQGDTVEEVWNTSVSEPADEQVERLRSESRTDPWLSAPTVGEVEAACMRLRGGRAPGVDGIPADVILGLDCLSNL